jgi:pyrimidine-nucleoside phosphorylase
MQIVDIILKKRGGGALTTEEINFWVKGYVEDQIPDYQISALLMALWFKGMDERETRDLTLAMIESGDTIDLSRIPGIKVDKHSTGGVGDTTTLIVAPLVAACGGKVAKMSGRGLGHTGGTLDKLESIPGLSIDQTMDSFEKIVSRAGLSVIGQTANLVPADKKLYALRDVTGTVDNLSLIASSIMSKKIASGSDAIVLDVKTGSGAFMKDTDDAVALAEAMVDIGVLTGRNTMAVVTDMDQPLGNAVGNALEVQEAIEILKGEHKGDLLEVSLVLASWMLVLSGKAENDKAARERLIQAIESGEGLKRLAMMIEAQGGDPRVTDDVNLLPRAAREIPMTAEKGGWITSIRAEEIGVAALLLGAGRTKKSDVIDPAVGLWMKKRLGDPVKPGDVLAVLYVNDQSRLEEVRARFSGAVEIGPEAPAKRPLIHRIITRD